MFIGHTNQQLTLYLLTTYKGRKNCPLLGPFSQNNVIKSTFSFLSILQIFRFSIFINQIRALEGPLLCFLSLNNEFCRLKPRFFTFPQSYKSHHLLYNKTSIFFFDSQDGMKLLCVHTYMGILFRYYNLLPTLPRRPRVEFSTCIFHVTGLVGKLHYYEIDSPMLEHLCE